MHNWPGLPAGAFGVCSGPMMSAANAFKITVTGRGGHAAAPQDCDDPVPAVLAIGQALQTILTRSKRPLDAARSEEHTSELQSLLRISSAVFCLTKKNKPTKTHI